MDVTWFPEASSAAEAQINTESYAQYVSWIFLYGKRKGCVPDVVFHLIHVKKSRETGG
jgi:hypothetical protein